MPATSKSKYSRKKRSRQVPRKSPSENTQANPTNAVTAHAYEVEKIVNYKIKNGEVYFEIKWKGYGSDENSFELASGLYCSAKLKNFVAPLFEEIFHTNQFKRRLFDRRFDEALKRRYLADRLNFLPILGKHFIERSSLTFVEHDVVVAYRRFLGALIKNDQLWCLYSVTNIDDQWYALDMKLYREQLHDRLARSYIYPNITVDYPEGRKAHYTTPPPPLSHLAFSQIGENEPVEGETLYTERLEETCSFLRNDDGTEERSRRERKIVIDALINPQPYPKYRKNLKLNYFSEYGWALCITGEIELGTPILEMTGHIIDESWAHKLMIREGFPFVITSVFKIGNTRKCLDQRWKFGFDKFIGHSCYPSCRVKLEYGSEVVHPDERDIPSLVVVTKMRMWTPRRPLTIDYFKSYTESVESFFANREGGTLKDPYERIEYLSKNKINFVCCGCEADCCRKVLYIDEMASGVAEGDRESFLKEIPDHQKFKGTRIDDGFD